jgi:hypothetical protein
MATNAARFFIDGLNRTRHKSDPMLADRDRIDIVCAPDEGLAGKLKSGIWTAGVVAGRMRSL